jgi:hypothetical protein
MLTITKILLRHHISAAQFWEMGRGTRFELRRKRIPLGGEPERERRAGYEIISHLKHPNSAMLLPAEHAG